MSWDLRSSSTFETGGTFICSNQEGVKNPGFPELDSAVRMPKTVGNDSGIDVLRSKYGYGGVYSSIAALPNAVLGVEESCSKQSSSAVEANSRDTSLIDLKLGRFPDHKVAQIKDNPSFSPAQSSMSVKRARAGNLSSQTPICQVQGCNKDLSASKDYNKRHKVCEIHSKTATVIVNGIEQRFCQQCSRFHLLAEFDDGKRSCRKRLAGHNERRRKHHTGMHPGRAGRLITSYSGTRLLGASFAPSSFACQDVPHSSHLHPHKHEMSNWNRNVTEDYAAPLGIGKMKGQAQTKSHMHSFNSTTPCPSIHDDRLIPVAGGKVNEHYNSLLTNMANSDLDCLSLFQNTAVGSEELTVLDSSCTVQGLPPSSSSGCALSLLSSQSQTSQNISSRIPAGLPLATPTSHPHYGMVQISNKLITVSPQSYASGMSNVFHTSGITSAEETRLESLLITDGTRSDKYVFNEFIPSSVDGDGSTIDLLELSSQLHHVEHDRQTMQMKQENDPFFGLRIT